MSDPTIDQAIDQLAARVNRNGLSRTDPERFHAEKSDIAFQLRQLAKRIRGEPARRPDMTTWRPDARR